MTYGKWGLVVHLTGGWEGGRCEMDMKRKDAWGVIWWSIVHLTEKLKLRFINKKTKLQL